MRKIELDADALAVESFATGGETMRRGTVDAHESGPVGCSAATRCGVSTCIKIAPCDHTLCRVCPTA